MRAVDLFCGAGGLTRGLSHAGIEVVAGVDNDSRVRHTFERNNPDTVFIEADARELHADVLREWLGSTPTDRTLLAGCAPCRSFSRQRYGRRRLPEATLLGAFGNLVRDLRPGWVLMENVPGIAAVPGFSTFRRFRKLLQSLGYQAVDGVLNAQDFGVPQFRRRFVLLASSVSTPRLPDPKFGLGLAPLETVRQAIVHYPPIAAGEIHPAVPNHAAAKLAPQNLARLAATPHDGGGRESWPEALTLDCHDGRDGYSDVYGRLWWDRPASTLTARCRSLSNGRFGHPEQDRAISLREAAALQSFPDSYVFSGTQTSIASQIGNAVPVRLAQALGQAIALG